MPHEPDLRVLPTATDGDEPSDEALLAAFARSESAASSAFVARFQRRVFGLALTLLLRRMFASSAGGTRSVIGECR